MSKGLECRAMVQAPGNDKIDVQRRENDKAAAERLRMLKELAKHAKPAPASKKPHKDE